MRSSTNALWSRALLGLAVLAVGPGGCAEHSARDVAQRTSAAPVTSALPAGAVISADSYGAESMPSAAKSEATSETAPTANTEAYNRIVDNGFLRVSQEPLSTFSIDVDTASYANVRRFLTQNGGLLRAIAQRKAY